MARRAPSTQKVSGRPARATTRDATVEENEIRLRTIIRTVVDGILTIDERGIIESVNPATERIFGYTANEMVGRNVTMLMPPPFSRRHDAYIQRYVRTGRAHIIGIGREALGLRKDGTTFPIDLAVSEMRIGPKRFFTGIVRDITERKKAEQAIAAVSEDERRKFGRELHDGLGQQLTGIALLTKALQNKLERSAHPAAIEAASISDLMAKVLVDLKRQAHGLYPVELERHGLTAAIEELAANQALLFGIECRLEISGAIPPIETSAALHVYRVAQEAVNNAIKHGRAKRVCIRLERVASMLTLHVEDDGKGIPTRKPSRGMGLSIMRYRAAAIGGAIEIGRGASGGTRVRLVWSMPWREKRSGGTS